MAYNINICLHKVLFDGLQPRNVQLEWNTLNVLPSVPALVVTCIVLCLLIVTVNVIPDVDVLLVHSLTVKVNVYKLMIVPVSTSNKSMHQTVLYKWIVILGELHNQLLLVKGL